MTRLYLGSRNNERWSGCLRWGRGVNNICIVWHLSDGICHKVSNPMCCNFYPILIFPREGDHHVKTSDWDKRLKNVWSFKYNVCVVRKVSICV